MKKLKQQQRIYAYSSGTTGKQKGVESTHLNLASNVAQILAIEKDFHPGNVFMGVLV